MDIEVSPFVGFSAHSLFVCYPCSSPVMVVFVYHKDKGFGLYRSLDFLPDNYLFYVMMQRCSFLV